MKPAVVPEESERWTTVIVVLGQRDARVQRLDRRVVPGLDLADEDRAERRAVELQAALDAREVVGDGDRAQEHRDLHRRAAVLADRFCVFGLQRRVAGAEVDDLVLDRRQARAGADGLVVDLEAADGGAPLFVDGGGEGRAGARDGSGRSRDGRRSLRGRSAGRGSGRGARVARATARGDPDREQRAACERAQLVLDHCFSLAELSFRPAGAGRGCRGASRVQRQPRRPCSSLCSCFLGRRVGKRRSQPDNSLLSGRCRRCEHFVKAAVGSGSRIRGACG